MSEDMNDLLSKKVELERMLNEVNNSIKRKEYEPIRDESVEKYALDKGIPMEAVMSLLSLGASKEECFSMLDKWVDGVVYYRSPLSGKILYTYTKSLPMKTYSTKSLGAVASYTNYWTIARLLHKSRKNELSERQVDFILYSIERVSFQKVEDDYEVVLFILKYGIDRKEYNRLIDDWYENDKKYTSFYAFLLNELENNTVKIGKLKDYRGSK